MKEPDHLHQITTYVTEKITELEPGNIMFLPGGWNDGIGKNVHLVYVITRQDDGTYSFIVCNVGPGNEYHLSNVTPESELRYTQWTLVASTIFCLFFYMMFACQVLPDQIFDQNQSGADF